MTSQKRRLVEILRQTSFKQSDAKPFHLASGVDSLYYVDCKQALSDPEFRRLAGAMICQLVSDESLDAVGGLELGAYPIACAVSDKVYAETGKIVRVFVVRKEAKKHGIKKLVAGDARFGDKALIVDDVITSGSSAIQAINAVREEGLNVERVIALVDREESDGRANIEKRGVRFQALCTLTDLISDGGKPKKSDSGNPQKRLGATGQSSRALAAG